MPADVLGGGELTAEPLELIGLILACAAAATALVAPDQRLRLAAMVLALAVAPVLVLGDVWDQSRVVAFRESPPQVGGALAVGAVAIPALALCFRRFPDAFAVASVAVLALRVPVDVGGETANLLVPLYVVIAGGVGARVLARQAPADRPRVGGAPTVLRLALAATLVLYAVQASYSEDVSNAIENVGFFLVPFAILAALLLDVDWSRRVSGRVLVAIAVLAALVAGVGIGQWLARDLFLNPELYDANQLHSYFRVNSVFFDPNIFGRYLALAIVALAAYLVWGAPPRPALLAAATAVIALIGLAFSFSITSFGALLAGLGIVAVLRWGWRGAAVTAALGGVGLAVLLVAGGTPTSDIQSDRSIDSGRTSLIEGGLELANDRPLAGWGSGSFGAVFYERIEPARTTVSHSEPITVAAEQGAIGVAVYLAVVISALLTLLGGGASRSLSRSAVAACFVAMLVHSLGYAGFVIDPATWALLGLGIALRASPSGEGPTTTRGVPPAPA